MRERTPSSSSLLGQPPKPSPFKVSSDFLDLNAYLVGDMDDALDQSRAMLQFKSTAGVPSSKRNRRASVLLPGPLRLSVECDPNHRRLSLDRLQSSVSLPTQPHQPNPLASMSSPRSQMEGVSTGSVRPDAFQNPGFVKTDIQTVAPSLRSPRLDSPLHSQRTQNIFHPSCTATPSSVSKAAPGRIRHHKDDPMLSSHTPSKDDSQSLRRPESNKFSSELDTGVQKGLTTSTTKQCPLLCRNSESPVMMLDISPAQACAVQSDGTDDTMGRSNPPFATAATRSPPPLHLISMVNSVQTPDQTPRNQTVHDDDNSDSVVRGQRHRMSDVDLLALTEKAPLVSTESEPSQTMDIRSSTCHPDGMDADRTVGTGRNDGALPPSYPNQRWHRIRNSLIATKRKKCRRVSGFVKLSNESQRKGKRRSSYESKSPAEFRDLGQGSGLSPMSDSTTCGDGQVVQSKTKRRKQRVRAWASSEDNMMSNDTREVNISGREFDGLARAGQLDSYLCELERDGLYKEPEFDGSKHTARHQEIGKDCSGEVGGEAHHSKSSAALKARIARLMKSRSELGILHMVAVSIPRIRGWSSAESPTGLICAQSDSHSSSVQELAKGNECTEPKAQEDEVPSEYGIGAVKNQLSLKAQDENVPLEPEAVAVKNQPSLKVQDENVPIESEAVATKNQSSRRSNRLQRIAQTSDRKSTTGVIDLTNDDDSEIDLPLGAYAWSAALSSRRSGGQHGRHGNKGLSEVVATNSNGVSHACGPVTLRFVEHPMLTPLTNDEAELVELLTRGKGADEPLATIPGARITLCRDDFKRLRGVRWLNDEIINAYAALINRRNMFHIERQDVSKRGRRRPRTFVFNTYFHTRLASSGYDFPGVSRWTRRAGVDVMEKDLLLIPVNLGNNHWVLSGIDLSRRMFLYLDSMHGRDVAGVIATLKRWLYDEVNEKHGLGAANELGVDTWSVLHNRYIPHSDGGGVTELDSPVPSPGQSSTVSRLIPKQRDSGSCGVFTAKIADCLEMGIAIYFGHQNIKLIRSRMALDLYHRMLPG